MGWPIRHNGQDSRAFNRERFGGLNGRSVHQWLEALIEEESGRGLEAGDQN
jgi:hypothetical protein